MKVLLDHCVPKRFGRLLTGHQVKTTFSMGWGALTNSALLRSAAQSFDVFLTVDQNVQFQHNLSKLPLPVVILAAVNNRFDSLEPFADTVCRLLSKALLQELLRVEPSGKIIRVVAA